MKIGHITLDDVLRMELTNVSGLILIRTLLYESYEDFQEVVLDAIESIVERIARNPQHMRGKSEDQITNDIVMQLQTIGFDASFDTVTGGHCDITVKGQGGHIWLGEAKIARTLDWLLQGFQQLDTRYMPGGVTSSSGGILIYYFHKRIDRLMGKWRSYLQVAMPRLLFSDCTKNPLSFYTEYAHQRTGLQVKIKHIPMSLYFRPVK
ncbi:hypothetical protein DSECCO2_620830 [anaerobic digester metagenome]